ncbi:hypothetical protein H5P36_25010 [Bacillus sp. APMAM]|nr:hypothetical protein [Bacillus sp. APMAM]RTZ53149.1 hypothetical protein EKO25_24945 [Bacillus sp. SAJ1]
MNVLIGILLICWGFFILVTTLFNKKTYNQKDNGKIGVSGFIEFEFLFNALTRLPLYQVKILIILIGMCLILFGAFILI